MKHTLRWRWIRMYLGHRTKRPRSFFARMSPPMRKLRAFFWNRGSDLEELFEPPLAAVLILRLDDCGSK